MELCLVAPGALHIFLAKTEQRFTGGGIQCMLELSSRDAPPQGFFFCIKGPVCNIKFFFIVRLVYFFAITYIFQLNQFTYHHIFSYYHLDIYREKIEQKKKTSIKMINTFFSFYTPCVSVLFDRKKGTD